MGIRVNEHETLTLKVKDAELTVETKALFDAWIEKHLGKPIAQQFIPMTRKGERYLGSIVDPSGRVRHTFLMPGEWDKDWDGGIALGKELGGDLPDRIEHAMLLAFMSEEFQKRAYWSNTQHAGNSDNAWYQGFYNGYQHYYGKSAELGVRLVRRVTI